MHGQLYQWKRWSDDDFLTAPNLGTVAMGNLRRHNQGWCRRDESAQAAEIEADAEEEDGGKQLCKALTSCVANSASGNAGRTTPS